MPRICCVPGCRTGLPGPARKIKEKTEAEEVEQPVTPKPALFSFPAAPERLEDWRRRIPRELGAIRKGHLVCELHFDPRFVISERVIEFPTGHVLRAALGVKRLSPDAIPTVFPNCPGYLSKKLPKIRSDPEKRKSLVSTTKTNEKESNCSDQLINRTPSFRYDSEFKPMVQFKRPESIVTKQPENGVAHHDQDKSILGLGISDWKPQLKYKACQTTDTGDLVERLNNQLNHLKMEFMRKNALMRKKWQKERRQHQREMSMIKKREEDLQEQLFQAREWEDALPLSQKRYLNALRHVAKHGHHRGALYDEDFIVDCLLIRCRLGTAAYKFLRNQQGYPFCGVTCLKKNRALFGSHFGFDFQLFEQLKNNTANYEEKDRRGTLIFAQIKMAANDIIVSGTDFNTAEDDVIIPGDQVVKCENDFITNGTECVITTGNADVNFGNDVINDVIYDVIPEGGSHSDYELVFVFAIFDSTYQQMVSKFQSKGSIPAEQMCKLLLTCLMLVEEAGLRVEALTGDGGEESKECLAKLGLGNNKYDYFENPCDHNRKVHSKVDDHLMKSIFETVSINGL